VVLVESTLFFLLILVADRNSTFALGTRLREYICIVWYSIGTRLVLACLVLDFVLSTFTGNCIWIVDHHDFGR
jgi:hypothetical protein